MTSARPSGTGHPPEQARGVTVIVPTFNRAHYLGEALDSLLSQSRVPSEIIVVDDGSTDDTGAVVSAYRDPVRYIRKENGGKASAVNVGLAASRGDLIYVFDDDDIAYPDAIEKLLEPLERDPSLGFAHGALTHFVVDAQGRRVEKLRPPPTVAERGHHFAILQQRCCIAHNASIVRRRCYDEVGFLDESFKRSEDFEFLLRLTARFDGASVPTPVLHFRDHAGLRGDATSLHGVAVRDRIHYTMEQRMFGALRGKVPIERYAGKAIGAPLTHEERFDAWLVRSISMAAHGLWAAFDEDIGHCGALNREIPAPITAHRARLLSQAFSHWYAYVDERDRWLSPARSVRRAISALGSDAVRPIARGFYWAARNAYADGKRWVAMRCAAFAARTLLSGKKSAPITTLPPNEEGVPRR